MGIDRRHIPIHTRWSITELTPTPIPNPSPTPRHLRIHILNPKQTQLFPTRRRLRIRSPWIHIGQILRTLWEHRHEMSICRSCRYPQAPCYIPCPERSNLRMDLQRVPGHGTTMEGGMYRTTTASLHSRSEAGTRDTAGRSSRMQTGYGRRKWAGLQDPGSLGRRLSRTEGSSGWNRCWNGAQ